MSMLTDCEFIHYGENAPMTESDFVIPTNEELATHRLFNIPNSGFFLSRKTDTTSHWFEHCKEKAENGDERFTRWLSSSSSEYTITNADNILVITMDNIVDLFETFGDETNTTLYYLDKKNRYLETYQKEIMELEQYLRTFKYKFNTSAEITTENQNEFDKIIKTMKRYNGKVKPNLPLKKKTFNEWCMILSRIAFLYNNINGFNEPTIQDDEYMEKYHSYKELCYDKIREAGYDGIYFPQSLITHKYRFTHDLIYIREFLKGLGSDTLIVWKWVF